MKPGWQTTEFWLQIIKMVGSIALASGVFDPGSIQVATDTTTQLIGPIMQLLGVFGFTATGKELRTYTIERTKAKSQND